MKISQVEIYQAPIKLKAPFITSLQSFKYAENVFVVIKTDEGLVGYGECSPFPSINGETMETCQIVGKLLATGLIGKNPLKIENCSSIMDKLIFGNSSIKSAFDIALYDIASQHAELPLYAFLGGKNDKVMLTDYTVSLGSPNKMRDDAGKIAMKGFQVIKVKLGGSKKEDVNRIKAIREYIGNEIPIRIDANQGWSVKVAIETLKELKPFNIQYCEEPIPSWEFMNLPKVRQESPIPVMADESCADHHDAQRLIDLDACKYFNIKLGKSSGIFKAKKIIDLAEKADIYLQIGGFIESRLGFTASAHLALASENIMYYDFDTPLMMSEDPIVGGISYDKFGEISVPDKPGLGAKVEDKYLKGLEHKIIIS